MTGVVRRLLRAGLLLVALLVAAVLLVFSRTPRVNSTGDVSVNDVRRARALLARNDPRRVRDGVANLVVLTQQDVTLLTQYAASRWRRAASQVTLRDGSAEVQVSVDVNVVPFARWLDVDATVRNADGLPTVERLRVGHLPVPAFAAEPVAEFVLARLGADMSLSLAREMVHSVAFTPTSVRLAYTWQKDATTRVRDMLLPPADLLRLQAAHEDLSRLIRAQVGAGPRPLVTLLVPMLQAAATRAAGGDAVAEHRAVLVTLTLYVTRRSLGRHVRRARSWSAIPHRIVTLGRRADLAKHFLVSAVVASQSGEALADAVGRAKEVEDSRGGTGFSFADIAADRAGTRFGELAVRDPSRLTDAATAGLDESAIMPVVTDLPESMTAAQFEQRFGGIGAPAYAAMMQRIESRLAALPLYRP